MSRFLSHGVCDFHVTRCRSTSGLEEVKEIEQLRLKSHSFSADARIALLAPTKLVLMVKRLRAAFHCVMLPSSCAVLEPYIAWHDAAIPCQRAVPRRPQRDSDHAARQPVRLQQWSKGWYKEPGLHRRRPNLQHSGTLHVQQDRCAPIHYPPGFCA